MILARESLFCLRGNCPISTIPAANSFSIRRHIAGSRIGAIIRKILTSRITELFGVVFFAVFMLLFFGSRSEGQISFFDSWIKKYVEERALALDLPHVLSASQLADMNSLFAGTGGDGAVSPTPSENAVTVNESAVLAIMPPDGDYLNNISENRTGIINYTVQEGDLLSFIASDFGVTQQTLIWANNLKNADNLTPGQVLRIPPVSGVVHTIVSGDTAESLAKKYGADMDRIIAYNHLPQDGSIDIGDEIIIPDGKIAQSSATSSAVAVTATTFSHLPNLGDYFLAPTTGYNWGRIHGRNGVDIANSCGTAIHAAAEGTVTVSDAVGYNGGFGQYIKITHPNGTETLYAHASKLLVEVGQTVTKGQLIALMGTTGNSTGCHLHFEVHGARNPLSKY